MDVGCQATICSVATSAMGRYGELYIATPMHSSSVFGGAGPMAVPRLDTKAFTELNIVFAVEHIGDHTVEATPCIPHRSRSGEVDWVPSNPIGLGNEGEGMRLGPAVSANTATMRSLHRPQ